MCIRDSNSSDIAYLSSITFYLDSATVLGHAFVTSRIDYGNSLFAKAPKIWTDKLQRDMNDAASIISENSTVA